MKLGIISDSHDNLANLDKAINYVSKQKIKTIIHCGDVSSNATLKYLLKNFKGKVFLATGNTENNQKYSNNKRLKLFENQGWVSWRQKKIAFCHYQDVAKDLCATGQYDFVFYGHTHKPWLEKFKVGEKIVIMLNPGTLAGLFAKATMAVYDDIKDEFELILLESI